MITLKKYGYTDPDFIMLHSVIADGIKKIPCQKYCTSCLHARACADLCRLDKYLQSIISVN